MQDKGTLLDHLENSATIKILNAIRFLDHSSIHVLNKFNKQSLLTMKKQVDVISLFFLIDQRCPTTTAISVERKHPQLVNLLVTHVQKAPPANMFLMEALKRVVMFASSVETKPQQSVP